MRAATDLVEGTMIGRIEETPESQGGDSKTTSPRIDNISPAIMEAEKVDLKNIDQENINEILELKDNSI